MTIQRGNTRCPGTPILEYPPTPKSPNQTKEGVGRAQINTRTHMITQFSNTNPSPLAHPSNEVAGQTLDPSQLIHNHSNPMWMSSFFFPTTYLSTPPKCHFSIPFHSTLFHSVLFYYPQFCHYSHTRHHTINPLNTPPPYRTLASGIYRDSPFIRTGT